MADHEAVARRLIEEGFSRGDFSVVDALCAPHLVEHQDFGPDHPAGPEGVKAVIASLRRAFPDFRIHIEDLAVAGDIVWMRMIGSGTHLGPFMGHGPSGRGMSIQIFDAMRVEGGMVTEHWGVPDRLAALFQRGLATPPGRPGGVAIAATR